MIGHHHHGHSHAEENYNKAFAIGVALNLAYVVVEAGFGLTSRSLALLADAGHNLSDVLCLLMAWAANHLSRVKPSKRRTYGWGRSSIIAALLNAILLLVAIGGIGWEAIHRLASPEPVPGRIMMLVAGIGVLINAATAVLFMRGRERDLNIRGAFLHMAADAGVSAAVVIGGLIITQTQLFWIDPLLSLVVVAVIAVGTWGLLRDSVNLSVRDRRRGGRGISLRAAGDQSCSRSARLGNEHDEKRAHRASGEAGRKAGRCTSGLDPGGIARAFRDRAHDCATGSGG
jgi:cobalt-zinc-cadmium efflux system protein